MRVGQLKTFSVCVCERKREIQTVVCTAIVPSFIIQLFEI